MGKTFDQWMEELREYAKGKDLSTTSPWLSYDMAAALDEEDLWIDRYAARYTPQEAFDEANSYKET